MLRFHDLTQRYGEVSALALLMEMERHVRLNSTVLADVDPEARLQAALSLMQDTTSPSDTPHVSAVQYA